MERIPNRNRLDQNELERLFPNAEYRSRTQIANEALDSVRVLVDPANISSSRGNPSEMSSTLFELFTHPQLGPIRDRNCGYTSQESIDKVVRKIQVSVEKDRPIPVSLHIYLGKVANPLANLGHIQGGGAYWTLARLSSIQETVKQIYQPGLRFIVCGETRLLRGEDITEREAEEADRYFRESVELMEVGNFVEVHDMFDIASEGRFAFRQRYEAHRQRLINGRDLTSYEEEMLQTLVRTGWRNINPFTECIPVTPKEVLEIYASMGLFGLSGVSLNGNYQATIQILENKARREAANILAGTIAKHESPGFGQGVLPQEIINVTITRKPNRIVWYPISRKGGMPFPASGEIVVDRHNNVRISPLVNIVRSENKYTAVISEEDSLISYFRTDVHAKRH